MIDKFHLQAIFESSEFRRPEDAVGFLLWRVTHRYQREIDRACAEIDLTHLQFVVLVIAAWLGRESSSVTQSKIADFSGIHKMQVSSVLKTLDTKGLIDRSRGDRDERMKNVSLTQDGAVALQRALPLVEAAQRRFFGSNEQIGIALNDALKEIVNHWQQDDD